MPRLKKEDKREMILSLSTIVPDFHLEHIYNICKSKKWNFDDSLNVLLEEKSVLDQSNNQKDFAYQQRLKHLGAVQTISSWAPSIPREQIKDVLSKCADDTMHAMNVLMSEGWLDEGNDEKNIEEHDEDPSLYLAPVLDRVSKSDQPQHRDICFVSQGRMINELSKRLCGQTKSASNHSSTSAPAANSDMTQNTLHLLVDLKNIKKKTSTLLNNSSTHYNSLDALREKGNAIEEKFKVLRAKIDKKKNEKSERDTMLEKYRQRVRGWNARIDEQKDDATNALFEETDNNHELSQFNDESDEDDDGNFILVDEENEDLFLDDILVRDSNVASRHHESAAPDADTILARHLQHEEFKMVGRALEKREHVRNEIPSRRSALRALKHEKKLAKHRKREERERMKNKEV
uniref:Uncharacterized protein n=1 Tax=Percolomonas cosmopolitus TaxID=63605 RepID=A0A7S1KR55_9EUKA